MRVAEFESTCPRCHGPIVKGQWIDRFNRPNPGTWFHAKVRGTDTCDTSMAVTIPPVSGGSDVDVLDVEPTVDVLDVEPTVDVEGLTDAERALKALGIALGPLVTPKAPAMDEDRVRQIVDEALASRPGSTLTLTRWDGETVKLEGQHYLMPRLLALLNAGIHVYLWGPAGSGKTTAGLVACRALGKADSEIDTLDASTPKSGLMGYRSPTGEPVETALTRTYAHGQGYIADELDNAPAGVQSIKNSTLANGHMPAAWGMIPRGDGFVYVGTGNTPGRPTEAFPDRRPMSAAFKDRLYFLHWPVDENMERRFAGLPEIPREIPEPRTCTKGEWVAWVLAVRAWASEHAPTLMNTPRASYTGWDAISKAGASPDEAAHGTIFRGADDELVAKALRAVPLP